MSFFADGQPGLGIGNFLDVGGVEKDLFALGASFCGNKVLGHGELKSESERPIDG